MSSRRECVRAKKTHPLCRPFLIAAAPTSVVCNANPRRSAASSSSSSPSSPSVAAVAIATARRRLLRRLQRCTTSASERATDSKSSRRRPGAGAASKHGVDTIAFDTVGFGFGPGLPLDGTPLRRRLGKYNSVQEYVREGTGRDVGGGFVDLAAERDMISAGKRTVLRLACPKEAERPATSRAKTSPSRKSRIRGASTAFNGFVECVKQQCPSIEGCYTLLDPRDNECCYRCTGCTQDGVYHESDTEWTDRKDPCVIFTCKSGIITKSTLRCYTPCSNPIPAAPGQCCPVCAGCLVNGQKVTADRSVTTTEDPCVTCRCNNGQLTCAKQACPILNCPAPKIVHVLGECCPHCRGSRRFLPPPKGACMIGTMLYASGKQFLADHCAHCTCFNSTISCTKETCPVLECPREYQTPGRCCPQCPVIEESKTSCVYNGKVREDGESWKLDSCKACACKQGKVRCAMPMCPIINEPCPPNTKLERPKDQCCARCVESDGVCTVFGDPHYRTFDGKFYSFKGPCKYQLVSDCAGRTFSIRVTNDARSTKSSAWTKTIAIKIGDLKVNLGQKMRVKVNGKKVDVPYAVANRLDINRTIDSVIVNTQIGIKVLWDGISYLEVSAPSSYRGRLCGLCGNFNSVTKDDFTTRRGRLLQDPQQFGQSWAVGAKKMCVRARPGNVDKERRCRGRKDHRLCNRLRSQIFDACHKKVNPMMYYKACLQDMCECPTEHCFCESFVAYVHECQRLGIQLPHWRKATKCRTVWEQPTGPANFVRRLH